MTLSDTPCYKEYLFTLLQRTSEHMQDFHTLAPVVPDGPDRYLIQDPDQLRHLLLQLARHPEIVSICPAGQREPFALSALLEIGPDYLILDASPHEETQTVLLASPSLQCISSLARVHIQFEAAHPRACLHEGLAAIRIDYPQKLYYLQRRDYFRLTIPARQPVHCCIVHDGNPIEAEVADISLGGISLLGPVPGLPLYPGMQVEGCRIDLPETGTILVDLIVCTLRETGLRAGRHNLRIGCRFAQLGGSEQTLVQRYIHHIERNRINHE